MPANVLDTLIENQNSRGLRPATALQIQADPTFIPPVQVAPVSGMLDNATPANWEQANWNKTTADLRDEADLDLLRSRAALNKLQFENQSRQAPLQDTLLEARANAAGAHDRFLRAQDEHVLRDTHGFFSHLTDPNAPLPSQPGYDQFVLAGLKNNPRFAETAGGREILKQIGKTHDTQLSIADMVKGIPAGFRPKSFVVGGGNQSHVTVEPIPSTSGFEKELKGYGLTPAFIKSPMGLEVGNTDSAGSFVGSHTGNVVRMRNLKGELVSMPTAEYERFGGVYGPETTALRKQAAAATTAVDRTALAQQALQDPNATEAERAAARKILTGK